jgi:hypothetical protein
MNTFGKSAVATTLAFALAGCGGGGSDPTSPSATVDAAAVDNSAASRYVMPRHAVLDGKNLEQWTFSYWEWVTGVRGVPDGINPLETDCRGVADGIRSILDNSGGPHVLYWTTTTLPTFSYAQALTQVCNQSANVIPAGTYIFLATLQSLSYEYGLPSRATAASETASVEQGHTIQDVFVTIDGKRVTPYSVVTSQFTAETGYRNFFGSGPPPNPPSPVTGVGGGYYVIVKPLPPGPHTIHYGGTFNLPAEYLSPSFPAEVDAIDVTLLITVGAAP